MRTLLPGVVLACALIVLPAAPAAADPATPTNYQSTVFDVAPDVTGVEFAVVGGDAFLEVVVSAGHTLFVPGYFGEPYARVDADGSVWLNRDSPAYYINQDRFGNVQAPPEADGIGDPRWERVGDDGRFAWQDHRIHWMSYDLPPTVAGDRFQVVFPWEVPVVVDGQEASVRGELVWIPSRNPVAPLLAGLIGLLPLVWWDRLRPRHFVALITVGVAVALTITVTQYTGTPAGARELPVWLAAPLASAACAAGALVLGKRRPRSGRLLLAISGALLLLWAVGSWGTMSFPVLPAAALPDLQRAGVGFVAWLALGLLAAVSAALLRSPGRA